MSIDNFKCAFSVDLITQIQKMRIVMGVSCLMIKTLLREMVHKPIYILQVAFQCLKEQCCPLCWAAGEAGHHRDPRPAVVFASYTETLT